jgi:hypothetical protein
MIQANELRIGNWVQHPDSPNPHQVNTYGILNQSEKNIFEPISLTEDWLLKFGFETWHKRDWDIGGVGDGQLLTVTTYAKNPIVRVWNQDIIHINYVHQLQNLYFALTGTELELKNEKN